MSLFTFLAYGIDKRRARRHRRRTPESVLLTLGICGGALGALFGMTAFRHKTRHFYFWVINVVALLLQIVLFVWLCGK